MTKDDIKYIDQVMDSYLQYVSSDCNARYYESEEIKINHIKKILNIKKK